MSMIRKPTNDLSIRPKMSATVLMAMVVGGLFSVIVACYFAYSSGIKSGHGKFEEDEALISQLTESVSELRGDLDKSQRDLIFAQRQQQIQQEAYKQLSKAYANSEQKNSVLGTRLDFYRSIISPEDGQSGPAIQSLDPVYADGKLSFDIILVQAIKHKHQVRGNLKVTLYDKGIAVGQWPLSSTRSVSYQYFQQISGSIEAESLVDGAKIKVELKIQDGEKLERWFDAPQAPGS